MVIESSHTFSEIQLEILRILLEKPYKQNELQNTLEKQLNKSISAQNLSYHLGILEREQLIEKKVIAQIGNARINEIFLNNGQLQRIRHLLHIEIQNFTLVTGFGRIETGYKIPDIIVRELKKFQIFITRIVCFTTSDARKIRDNQMNKEHLLTIDEYHDQYDFDRDYCYLDSDLYQHHLDEILRKELKTANLVIDLTPMSKLYSFKMLELANRYQLPCFFLGKNAQQSDLLIWMSGIKLEGKMNAIF
jgi:DNA-binding PadR family transcriptional regulator